MARFFVDETCTINTDEIVIIRPYTEEISEIVFKGGEIVRYEETYDSLIARLVRNEDR